ncbi:MAG: hypothetical protein EU532_01525 [Promethearchaeota archaeon]|nr:MAG: hypothetical protein EU532_01525 [Candidatus Lokiarchaeota archaeon]
MNKLKCEHIYLHQVFDVKSYLFLGFIMFTIAAYTASVSLFKWFNDESKAKKLLPNAAYNNRGEDLRFNDEEIVKELNL